MYYRYNSLQNHNLTVYLLSWESYYKVVSKLCYISLFGKNLLGVPWIFWDAWDYWITVCLSDSVKFFSPPIWRGRTEDRLYQTHQWLSPDLSFSPDIYLICSLFFPSSCHLTPQQLFSPSGQVIYVYYKAEAGLWQDRGEMYSLMLFSSIMVSFENQRMNLTSEPNEN